MPSYTIDQEVPCRANRMQSTLIRITSIGAMATGIVMIALQIALLTMNDPLASYDYVSHGIWAGVSTEITSFICLTAVSKKTAPYMISGTIMAFYSSTACLVSVVLCGLSIFTGSCLLTDGQCDSWNDTEWVLSGFSFCTLCFCTVLTATMATSINSKAVSIKTIDTLLGISAPSIIIWGVASVALQIAALCTNDVTLSRGLTGQGIWAGAFYIITGAIGMVSTNLKRQNAMLLIVLSTMSALFSIYITVQTGVAVSSGDCNPLLYPCENWRGIEWALMAFSVVAFTEATFIAFLSSIAFLIDAEASRKETRESNVSLDLPTIRSDGA